MNRCIISTLSIILLVSSQLASAGSITDTYTTGDTLTTTKMDNIKTAVNGNAADVSSNTTRINLLEGTGGMTGTQGRTGVSITSTANTQLLAIEVPSSTSTDVVLNTHLYIEKSAGSGRYEFSIKTSSCAGTSVASTMWRPEVQTNSWVATTISFTAFHEITASTNYYLCARKYDSAVGNASVYSRALNAIYK